VTPEQHNKYLAYSHLGYGGLMFLIMSAFLTMFGVMMLGIPGNVPNGPPAAFMFIFWLFMAAMYALMIIPSFIAGFGLLKGKRWARTASIIAGVVAAMQFPIGTAVCVYTFWFLFSEPGKTIFDRRQLSLPSAQQSWAASTEREKEAQYVPPSTPPDWR